MEELKEMVIKNLDSQGVLDAIRAQLRASVFQAILSQEGKPGVSVPANDSGKIMETERGQACAELLREFMTKNGLNQTVGVFASETRLPAEQMDRRALETKLKLKGRPDQPLLFTVLDKLKEKQAQRPVEPPPASIPVSKPAQDPARQAEPAKPVWPVITKPIPERTFVEPPEKAEPQPIPTVQSQKPDLKPLARAPNLAPLEKKVEPEEKKKPDQSLNLERKFAAAGLGRPAVFEDDNPGAALPPPKKEEAKASLAAKDMKGPLAPLGGKEQKPQLAPLGGKDVKAPVPQAMPKKQQFPMVSKMSEEVEDDIEEDIEHDEEIELQQGKGQFIESMGTSSLGVDASVDSLVLEDYDHVEKVAKSTK